MLKRLKDFLHGYMKLHYGSCGGDPVAWERDLLRRRAEEATRDDAGRDTREIEERRLEAGELVALRRPMRTDELS